MTEQTAQNDLLHALLELEQKSDGTQSERRLVRLLTTMLREVQDYASHHIGRIKLQGRIGLALTAEHDIDKLLEMIVSEARGLTHADAGTLYTLSEDGARLDFKIVQNDSLGIFQGGASGAPVTLPPVPLTQNGAPNHANVSSHVALSGQVVNIADVYQAEGFDFTGPRKYDAATGYRSQSMLVMPLINHENEIIGVLQLLNATDPETGAVIAFHVEYVEMTAALASQAAVALTTARLMQELSELFHCFIRSIATAIDCKSPYTGGHIKRVVTLSMLLADQVNADESGPFKDRHFTPEDMEELRLAAWLHDVGKIATPEYVVDKRTKLETVFDRIDLVASRFQLAAKCLENQALKQKLVLYEAGAATPEALAEIDRTLAVETKRLRDDMEFIRQTNTPGEFLRDEAVARLRALAARRFEHDGQSLPLITANELENLCIRKGTLNDNERQVIELHARMTKRILDEIPFPKNLSRVPSIAAGHHEKLDGSGYPEHLAGDNIPLQSRILAIADVFEALTAQDRPYKKAMGLEEALRILGFMKKDGHIDADLYNLFISTGVHEAYAKAELAHA